MKSLIIAEKPSVAGDIATALGGFQKNGSVYERHDLVVTNAIGHLVELHVPEAEAARGMDSLPVIPPEFGLQVVSRTRDQFLVVERQLKRSDIDCVINACDAGREGELIFQRILEIVNCHKPVKRMWVQSMTMDSLREAFDDAKPGSAYYGLRDAAMCRQESDWLVGINGSRGLMELRKHQTGRYESVTAGRVQTPTLALTVDRENQIRDFVSQDFWEVVGTFSVAAGLYRAKWRRMVSEVVAEGEEAATEDDAKRFYDRTKAQEIVSRCAGQPVESASDEVTPGSSLPPKLLDLTTLQREANKRFKLPAKKTLGIAQRLYEVHKVTTYPRTDSSCLPEDYVEKTASTMTALEPSEWGRWARQVVDSGWVQPNKRIFNNSKISDHFAIIPTGVIPQGLDPDEKRIYDLIVRRFLAAFFPAAEFLTTKRTTVVAGETFVASGKVMTSLGWKAVMDDVQDEGEELATESGLCALQDGETPTNRSIEAVAGKTKEPPRYTEASLLHAMETAGNRIDDEELKEAMREKGLGTPATRADTLETLLNDRDSKGNAKEPYLRRDKNFLVPTPKAMQLIAFLKSCGIGFLTSAQTTGEWEERLARMERGEYHRDAFMQEIQETTRNLIDILRGEASKAPPAPPPSTALHGNCPACKAAGVNAGDRFFECANGCGFRVWREILRRKTSDGEMEALLNGETLHSLTGFYSETKRRQFAAGLRLTPDHKVTLVFDDDEAGPAVRLAVMCPKCESVIASKPALVECTDKDGCGFKVWRENFKRKFTDKELDKLIHSGEIKDLKGFVSKGGNAYSATVRLDRDSGKMELVFPDRR